MARPRYTLEQRIAKFWQCVDKSGEGGCWWWMAYRDADGYGRVRWRGKIHKAHRISYELAYGEYPEELCVLHDCDVPACVNPDHLFLVTHLDNAEDRVRKGRNNSPHGETLPQSKLTDLQVIDIRQRHAAGEGKAELAVRFGVSREQIRRIVNYQSRAT